MTDQYGYDDDAYQFGIVGGQITGGPNRPGATGGDALYTMLNCILRLLPFI